MSKMSTASETSSGANRSDDLDPGELIDRFQAGVWRYLRALGCEPNEADDLTQETFLAVLQKPFRQISPAATAVYLRRVAYNRLITERRRCGKVILTERLEQLDQAWTRLVGHDNGESLLDALKNCMNELTERARWALEMRFRDRLSRAEIASALAITENGAKNLMQRAKKQLRTCVEGKVV
jgi:RNA polymerase sigma-70 factor (ECF subfamily)